jgi:hypothetical protein
MEERITYFEQEGESNTAEVLALVKEKAQALGIKKIVLASTRGETARAAAGALDGSGVQLVVIPWQHGFAAETNPFSRELVDELASMGHLVHFGTMLFHTDNLYGNKTPQLMANLLRIFGQGTKVCVEITMMACDGGCIEAGEKVIAIGGTASGADTAMVFTAAPSTKMTRLKVHEIICKPLLQPKPESMNA